METWQNHYQRWLNHEKLDIQVKDQLQEMQHDRAAIKDAFFTSLSFGTGGIRGIIGPGTNRMNIYTVRKTVKAVAEYVIEHTVNYRDRGVVVAYDSRHMSQEFALEVAKVLGVYQIRTYIFDTIQPTPLLSFAVRHLGCVAGVMITASHNPPEYNGLKVYNEEGAQITSLAAQQITENMLSIEDELAIEVKSLEELEAEKLIEWLRTDFTNAYLDHLKQISFLEEAALKREKMLRIVFTPLHGTALALVTRGLQQLGFQHVHIVTEQATPDPNFSTVQSPNPEDKAAFAAALTLGKEVAADLLLATDPDADRLGVAVKDHAGEYVFLTGNQLGALLLDYILQNTNKDYLQNARMIKTIVTSELGRAIAASYGVETIDTLTGFKYIAEKINTFDRTSERFIFGYEESYGYLIKPFSRDKDAIQAAVLTCEMAEVYKAKGQTLLDALETLYQKHGYYHEGVQSLTLKGVDGQQQIVEIVDKFRYTTLETIGPLRVKFKEDYLLGKKSYLNAAKNDEKLLLPNENVIKYVLEDSCWVCIRPSGTEPKIKWYYGAYGKTAEEADSRLEALKEALDALVTEQESSSV